MSGSRAGCGLGLGATHPLLDSRLESGLGPDLAEPELREPDPGRGEGGLTVNIFTLVRHY